MCFYLNVKKGLEEEQGEMEKGRSDKNKTWERNLSANICFLIISSVLLPKKIACDNFRFFQQPIFIKWLLYVRHHFKC